MPWYYLRYMSSGYLYLPCLVNNWRFILYYCHVDNLSYYRLIKNYRYKLTQLCFILIFLSIPFNITWWWMWQDEEHRDERWSWVNMGFSYISRKRLNPFGFFRFRIQFVSGAIYFEMLEKGIPDYLKNH